MGTEEFLIYLFTCLLIQIRAPPLISCVSLGKSLNLSVPLFLLGELRNNIKTTSQGVKIMSQSSAGTRTEVLVVVIVTSISPSPTYWNINPKRAKICPWETWSLRRRCPGVGWAPLCGLPFFAVFPEWGPIRRFGIVFFFPLCFLKS